jgi:diketogulonate reductase-like aldo/keto reductase
MSATATTTKLWASELALGLGTWRLGEDPRRRHAEIEALRAGLELGYRLIDTAEFYGQGEAERMVGEAIRDLKDAVWVVTKVWPSAADPEAVEARIRASLSRLGREWVDTLLLHWPSRAWLNPAVFERLSAMKAQGVVRSVGVSNYPLSWFVAARSQAAAAGLELSAHQVPYSLKDRRVEASLLPYHREHGDWVLAWGALGQGSLPLRPALVELARQLKVTPYQLALRWVVRHGGVTALVRSTRRDHLRENWEALQLPLGEREANLLEQAYPPHGELKLSIPPWPTCFRLIEGGYRWWLRGRR